MIKSVSLEIVKSVFLKTPPPGENRGFPAAGVCGHCGLRKVTCWEIDLELRELARQEVERGWEVGG